MSQIEKWFERKFDSTFSVHMFPNLCARLRGTPARLEELVRAIPREVLTRKPGASWSAQENAGHLLDLEPLWLARVEDYANATEMLSVADLSNRKTYEANHNSYPAEEILADFRTARAKLMDRLRSLRADVHAQTALHPRMKTSMRMVDHLFFVAEHDDHHLARIWELGNPVSL